MPAVGVAMTQGESWRAVPALRGACDAFAESPIPNHEARLIPEVVELQRKLHVGLAQHRHRRLQVVALLAADAQLVAVDLRLDLRSEEHTSELQSLMRRSY